MSTPAGSSTWQPDLRTSVLVGGKFELLDRIGDGATSTVYKVRSKADRQIYALKVLKESAARHPRLAECFHRELQTGLQFDHPNVIRIFDSGEHEGWPYLVMEYINGRTLAELLQMGRMEMPEFEQLFRQLLSALDYVHGCGLIHRDIKPSNLMMANGTTWKLMDFGIAREAGSTATVGSTLGTPDYMSPERLLGKAANVASDLYASGMVFYESLAGAVPFRYMSPLERCTVIAPSVRDVRPDVPQWLAQAIGRCLAPKPDDRFISAHDLLRQAGSFEALPVEAAPAAPIAAGPKSMLQPFADYIGRDPGDPQKALTFLAEILRKLEQLESAGERHDPIMPQSVLLTPSGVVEISAHGGRQGRDTLVVASPKYTPPELLKGVAPENQQQRERAGIYSLGFLIYEYLLGETLFQREFRKVEETNPDLGWMQWQTNAAAKPAAVAQLVPGMIARLSSLLEQMLEKDPAKRPASYQDVHRSVIDTIRRTRATQQVQVPEPTKPIVSAPAPGGQLKQSTSTGKLIAISAVVTLLLLAILLAALRYFR